MCLNGIGSSGHTNTLRINKSFNPNYSLLLIHFLLCCVVPSFFRLIEGPISHLSHKLSCIKGLTNALTNFFAFGNHIFSPLFNVQRLSFMNAFQIPNNRKMINHVTEKQLTFNCVLNILDLKNIRSTCCWTNVERWTWHRLFLYWFISSQQVNRTCKKIYMKIFELWPEIKIEKTRK